MGPRVRAGAVLLVVFGLGVLAGIAFERHYWVPIPEAMSPAEEHQAAIVELRELLELEDQQVEQIHAILAKRQQIVQRVWEQLRPELQSEMRNVHTEIGELLRPDQRERFHEWLMQRRAEHEPETIILHER